MPSKLQPSIVKFVLFYSKEELAQLLKERQLTPLQDTETRNHNTGIIRRLSQRIGFPFKTYATAHYFYHRFVARYSLEHAHIEDIILACVSMASKVNETVKKLRDIYSLLQNVVHDVEVDADSKELGEIRDRLMPLEQRICEDVLFKSVDHHPQRFLIPFCRVLSISCEQAALAWRVLYDSFRSTVCIQFAPHVIAIAALYLAAKFSHSEPHQSLMDPIWLTSVCVKVEEVQDAILIILESHISFQDDVHEAEQLQKMMNEINETFTATKLQRVAQQQQQQPQQSQQQQQQASLVHKNADYDSRRAATNRRGWTDNRSQQQGSATPTTHTQDSRRVSQGQLQFQLQHQQHLAARFELQQPQQQQDLRAYTSSQSHAPPQYQHNQSYRAQPSSQHHRSSWSSASASRK